MAYLRHINQNSIDSHQTSPAYMITFVRWKNHDTSTGDAMETNLPLVVISDCTQVSVTSSKSSHIHQASFLLLAGDINYAAALAPGDFAFVNLVNDDNSLFGAGNTPQTASPESLYSRAIKGKQAINKAEDGFKGLFKIHSVRKVLNVSENGAKQFHYHVTAAAFTEFNQIVYFNPYLYTSTELSSVGDILNTAASQEWANNLNKDLNNLSKVFKAFIGFLIGKGFGKSFNSSADDVVVRNHNSTFLLPKDVASLMGITTSASGIKAADLFNYYVGIEKYGELKNDTSMPSDSEGLNPTMGTHSGMFYSTGPELSGVALIQAEPWGQVTAWSILNQYSNSLINEMYTSFKLTPDNRVMPVVVFRQKPFTSSYFKDKASIKNTPFLSLPRWVISPELITSFSTGKDEVARINFVHIVGKTRYMKQNDQLAQQAAAKLHIQDESDIKRSGLKPFIASCDFDFPLSSDKVTKAPQWNKLMFDWLNNGHLKENGTLICAGLTENIAVGDNAQIDDTVFHIESISHNMSLDANGVKTFRTTLQLSFGVDSGVNSKLKYPEMNRINADAYRINNYNKKDDMGNKNGMLPGFSDSQDVGSRTNGEKKKPIEDDTPTDESFDIVKK
jgi:hypothetical protein